MNLSYECFRDIAAAVVDYGDSCSCMDIVSALDGDYHFQALPRSVAAHILSMEHYK